MTALDPATLVPAARAEGDDPEDTRRLRTMLAVAERYLLRHAWCDAVTESYFGVGIGGVVAAFLFRIAPPRSADEWLWVVVGDLPPAYLVTDRIERPVDVLVVYCELMQDWVDSVLDDASDRDVFPVDAPRDVHHAELLAKRIRSLREEVIPTLLTS
jgi:hypothetical protein